MRLGIDYTTKEEGIYRVVVFDKKGRRVGKREVESFTRREAYYSVMNEMPLHVTWDAWRIRNIGN